MMNKEIKMQEISNRVYDIYKQSEEKNESDNIQNIIYFDELTLLEPKNEKIGLAEQNTYLVKKIDEQQKVLYEIYNDNMKIATVDDTGKIQFTDGFKKYLEELDERFSKTAQEADGKENFKLPEELGEEDIIYSKEEIEEIAKQKEVEKSEEDKQQNNTQDANNQEQDKDKISEDDQQEQEDKNNTKEEQELEEISKASGISKNEISSCTTIKPEQRVTDADTFEQIAGIEGKYEKIYVINANSSTDKNTRFAFMGITKDGEAEYIDSLETRGTTNTDKEVYKINNDGSTVKQQQVTEMFTTKDSNKMFSVTLGQYGIPEVDYLRRDEQSNQIIGSQVETENVRPTTRQVQEFMNAARTDKNELNSAVKKAEHGMEETNGTVIENIDSNNNNDIVNVDVNEPIKFHDGTKKTLNEIAEKIGVETVELIRKIEGMDSREYECLADKIEAAEDELKNEKSEDEFLDRFSARMERTPWGDAEARDKARANKDAE